IKDVPEHATVVGVPAHVIKSKEGKQAEVISGVDLNHHKLPDPLIEIFKRMEGRLIHLEEKLKDK
ncbi:serine O-acetyltransferase, partial [Candidatus Shapirobacteria bacterium]